MLQVRKNYTGPVVFVVYLRTFDIFSVGKGLTEFFLDALTINMLIR